MSVEANGIEAGWLDEKAAGARRRIDVTDMSTSGVQQYVRSAIDTDCVSFEQRGARTFLVVDE